MEYGYMHIFTREQNERRQFIALQEFGIESKSDVVWFMFVFNCLHLYTSSVMYVF